nr:glycosyltransferase [uncultured Draconibacterium sp.]
MTNNILVSIIVPIYNVEKYLSQCIKSIINQTHTNLEIILVNDGSPDNSGKIADKYASTDNRISVIHKKNAGVSSARNSGIDKATGNYICFSDADDLLEPDYVEYLLNLAVVNNADISYTSEMFTTFHKQQLSTDNIQIYSPEEATEAILCYRVPIGVYCKMFKKDFLKNNSLRFIHSVFIGEGFNFNTACFQRANKVVKGQKKIYFYRRDNSESAMTKFNIKKCEMAIYAINRIRKDFIINSKRIQKAWQFASWHTHCDMYYLIENANAGKNFPVIYKKCKQMARRKALTAFLVPTKRMERIRAIISIISPKLVARLILLRSKRVA